MGYCTTTELQELLSEKELAELTAEIGEDPNEAVAQAAIDRAGAEIDSYLALRYSLPLAATPPRIRALCLDMAVYHLFVRRGIADEVRRQRYQDALSYLRDVAAGKAQVIGADGLEPSGDAAEVVEVASQDRVFDRDKLSGW